MYPLPLKLMFASGDRYQLPPILSKWEGSMQKTKVQHKLLYHQGCWWPVHKGQSWSCPGNWYIDQCASLSVSLHLVNTTTFCMTLLWQLLFQVDRAVGYSLVNTTTFCMTRLWQLLFHDPSWALGLWLASFPSSFPPVKVHDWCSWMVGALSQQGIIQSI